MRTVVVVVVVVWCVLLLRTDIISMYQELEIGFLLTEVEYDEKRKKIGSSLSINRHKRAMKLVRDNLRRMCKWCIQYIVVRFYKPSV